VGMMVMMNLVTAVIVDEALHSAATDRDLILNAAAAEKREKLAQMRQLFSAVDADASGSLTKSELRIAQATEPDVHTALGVLDLGASKVMDLFDLLDTEHDGALEVDEFCEGLGRIMASPKPVDLLAIFACTRNLDHEMDSLRPRIKPLVKTLRKLRVQLSTLRKKMDSRSCPPQLEEWKQMEESRRAQLVQELRDWHTRSFCLHVDVECV